MFRFLQVLEQNVEALKTFLPELAIVFGPFRNFPDGVRLEGAKILSSLPVAFDQARGFEVGEVFGNGLLGNGEGGGELVNGGGPEGEAMKDGSTGGIGESGESEAKLIHNNTVVYLAQTVKQILQRQRKTPNAQRSTSNAQRPMEEVLVER
jgi:hypothetical protein